MARAVWRWFGIRTKRTRIAVLYDNEILLVKNWFGRQKWTLPGGGIHFWEDPLASARRELAEEVRIKISAGMLSDIGIAELDEDDLHYRYLCFLCRVKDKKILPDKRELIDAKWFSMSELPDDRTPVVDEVLKRLGTKT